jgi:DNA-binding MurR/RpiR family transcriptional regulator
VPSRTAIPYEELMERIRERLDGLSKAFQGVAKFILERYDRAAFLTAAELGRAVGVSESTVVRFANALGYAGYPEFQEVLQEVMRNRLTTVERLVSPDGRTSPHRDLFESILQTDIENIRLTLHDLDRVNFRRAVSAILEARRILIVGFRSASALALFLSVNLNWILGNVKVAGFTGQDLWEDIAHLGRKDLVIGIAFPRYTRTTVAAVSEAKLKGCKVVALTDSVLSPLSRYADIVLAAHCTSLAYSDSFVAPLSVINALLAASSMADKAHTMRRLRKMEEIWERQTVYHGTGSIKRNAQRIK